MPEHDATEQTAVSGQLSAEHRQFAARVVSDVLSAKQAVHFTPYSLAELVLNALRSLPVEQRMEAMGMEVCGPDPDNPWDPNLCGEHFDGKHWVEA